MQISWFIIMTTFFKGSKSICEAKSFRGIFQGSYFESDDEVANIRDKNGQNHGRSRYKCKL